VEGRLPEEGVQNHKILKEFQSSQHTSLSYEGRKKRMVAYQKKGMEARGK
jgi:hypothetical protein